MSVKQPQPCLAEYVLHERLSNKNAFNNVLERRSLHLRALHFCDLIIHYFPVCLCFRLLYITRVSGEALTLASLLKSL